MRKICWEKIAGLYKAELWQQQQENIRLLRENVALEYRVKELEAGLHLGGELNGDAIHTNVGGAQP